MLCLVLAAGFTANTAQAGDGSKILFINPGHRDTGFWKDVSDVMQAASDMLGFDLEIVSANRDPALMEHRGKDAIAHTDADYLILVNEYQLAPELLHVADQKNLPTILLLNDLTDAQKVQWGKPGQKLRHWLGSITPNNFKAGQEMAISLKRAAKATGLHQDGQIHVLALGGDQTTPASVQRLNGLQDVLNTNADMRLVDLVYANWSRETARHETARALSNNKIHLVWAANDAMALGAIDALHAAGEKPGETVFVVGMNWSKEALDLVIDGQMTLTHGGHFLAGGWAVVMLEDYRRYGIFGSGHPIMHFDMQAQQPPLVRRYKTLLGDSDWSRIGFHSFLKAPQNADRGYDFSLGRLLRSSRPKPE